MTMLQTEHADAELWLSTAHQEDALEMKGSLYSLKKNKKKQSVTANRYKFGRFSFP